MKRTAFRRVFFLLCVWAAVLATGLLRAEACQAQANDTGKNATQSQSGDADKSSPKNDKKGEEATTRLRIIVTNSDDKPVGNASVYVRFNESGGFLHHDKLAELSFKTNEGGTVKVPPVPQGKIMIQVIAKGLHTFGKWYDIEKDQDTIAIKLEPPPHWY
ncbi:MAG: carboxypeptidase-like regulatory domain-containing protein [Candidatus Acidiferrales bacterium]